jgi:hypothetical protein
MLKLVDYKKATAVGAVTIAGQNVSNEDSNTDTGNPYVGLLGSDDGKFPARSVALASAPVSTVLSGDGSLGDGSKARFRTDGATGKDYVSGGLEGSRTAQGKLYVVPFTQTNADGGISEPARNIQTAIETIKGNLSESTKDFFDEKGISFETQRRVGIGDLDANLYLGYDLCDGVYGEGIFGVKFPIAKKNDTPLILYTPTAGNNGHFEIQLGTQWRFDLAKWLNLDLDASYSFVLKRTEKRAAAFEGATVKNLGPAVDAKVNWGWFNGNVKFTLFHPDNECLGLTAGYGFYYKDTDKVTFADASASDFFGQTKTLDKNVLALRTKQISHKVKFEIFNYFDQFELFLGGAQVFAGKNAPQESDFHVGVRVEF